MKPLLAKAFSARIIWPLAGLGVLLLFNLLVDIKFYRIEVLDGDLYGPLISVLKQGSKVMLLALGMTLVIATRGVDLSVGSVMAVSGVLVAFLLRETGGNLAVALAGGIGAAATLGAFNGGMVALVRIQPIVATLIMMVLARGVAFLVTGGLPIKVTDPFIRLLGQGHLLGLPLSLFVVAVFFLLAVLLTRRTALGLFIESVGDNETASRFCGLPTRMVKVMVYVFCALCSCAAGLVSIGFSGIADADKLGVLYELDAITAVVVGGTALTGGRFSLAGSLVGALLIKTMEITLIRQGMNPAYVPVPKALIIIAVCLLLSEAFRTQMGSLFGRKKVIA